MNRFIAYLLGPELFWVLAYCGFRWLAARNVPPTAAGNSALEWATWLIASVGVPLSFVTLTLPGINRWAIFARLAVAGFIGVNACALLACDWIKYPEPGRNSGLMGLWIMAVIIGGIMFCISSMIAIYILRVSARG
jgi:hypothetical protein